MANRLSDDQLRESLSEYGEDVGPITPTTRSAWERRLSTLRKSKGVSSSRKSPLNAFSSDDSEIENSTSVSRRNKRTSLYRQTPDDRLNLNSPVEDFKKPISPSFTVQGRRMLLDKPNHLKNQNIVSKPKKNAGRSTTYDVETSDSDFDSDSSPFSKTRRTHNKRLSRASIDFKDASSSQNSPLSVNLNSFRRKPFDSSWQSNAESRFSKFNSSPSSLKPDPVGHNYHTNGYISNTLTNGEISESRVEEGSSTNYSHCISWLLLFGTATFFIIIGIVYVTELQKNSQLSGKSNSKFCNGVEKEDCEKLIILSRELHQLLTTNAGIYDCAVNGEKLSRNLTIPDAWSAMEDYFKQENRNEMDKFGYLFNESVKLLTRFPEMGIKSYSIQEDGNHVMDPSHINISALEAIQGSKSLKCRIRLSLEWTVTKIILLCCVGFFLFLCFLFIKFWKKRKEAQEKTFYAMVEKVIDILQENSEWSTENEPYKAVVKVRDAVIPPKERKQKLWLWDKVVTFIEENESRVSVEYRTISGEDFKVWKWQPFTASENEGGKQGKVWQGQAFSSLGKGRNSMYSLSPCLKIRNMFDSEVEYEEGWQTSIQDAILEKCEGNDGIRHIAIDTSNNEGCVYMLCSSSEFAGKAFNDLHGWWFDGKLVTVKYIPYKRYLERFPDSEHCSESLRPSNNKRLSLSTPFFSSALERS